MEKIEALLDRGEFKKALAAVKAGSRRDPYLEGEALRGLGLFAEAARSYSRATAGGGEYSLEAALGSARCWRALGDSPKAFAAAKKALSLSKRLRLLRDEAELEWALALRLAGRLDQAEKMLLRLLKGYRLDRDHAGASFVLWALGGLYRLRGRYAEGLKTFEDARAAAAKAGDRGAEGYALFGLGGLLRVAGFMGRALDCYVRARRLFTRTDDTFARAYAECGTANVLRQLGRLDEAWAGYERAHKLYSSLSDWADLGFVEWGMGEILRRNGDFRGAFARYKAAEKLFKGRSEPRGEALTMLSMAQLRYLMGDTAGAEKAHSAALKFIKRHGLHTHLETFT